VIPPNIVQNYNLDNKESFSINQTIDGMMRSTYIPWNIYGAVKAEDLHIVPFLIICLLYTTSSILCLLFSKHQPLKSRGIVPMAMNTFLLIDLFSGMLREWVFTLKTLQDWSCWYSMILGPNLLCAIIFIYLFSLLRFVTLTHLNLRKESSYKKFVSEENNDVISHVPLRFRLLKWFGRWWIQIIQIGLVYIGLCISNLIFFGPTVCTDGKAYIASFFILNGLIVLTLIAIEVYDMILLFISIRSKCSCSQIWKKMYKEDSYHYRAEFLLGYCLVGIPLTGAVMLTAIFSLSSVPQIAEVLDYWAPISNSLSCLAYWWIGCGYVLMVTIFKFCVGKCKKRTTHSSNYFIDELKNDPILFDLFESFAKSEFSAENLYAWKDILEFQNYPSLARGNAIFIKYLCQSKSELEINVSLTLCLDIKKKLDNSSDGVVNTISASTFDAILSVVTDNLTDTYSRFIFTSKYLKFTKMNEIVHDGLANE
jgi:hypothetical protein